jgi:hypothetical protein
MKTLRDYQVDIATRGHGILARAGILYLALAVRTGKTATALEVARLYKAKNVMFLTKKKAIDGILDDYLQFGYDKYFTITVTNDESMHKINSPETFDLVVHDEHHRCFLAGTKIDGVNIEDIDVGSLQKSFNFVTGKYEYKRVKNVFKNKLNENLIKIKCNGKEIVCTESHKIFTKRGWVEAGKILSSDELQVVQ